MPLFVCLSITAAIRLANPREYVDAYGYWPGLELFLWNLRGGTGLGHLNVILTLGALPAIPLLAWSRLPRETRVFALVMLLYVGSVLWGGTFEETRLLLLPLALVLLPALVVSLRA